MLLLSQSAQADPLECVSKSKVKAYQDLINESSFIIENCYYCEPETWRLIFIEDTEVKNCHWNNADPDEVAVYGRGTVLWHFQIDDCGEPKSFRAIDEPFNDLLILNYIYAIDASGVQATILEQQLEKRTGARCTTVEYPRPQDLPTIQDTWYAEWYHSKRYKSSSHSVDLASNIHVYPVNKKYLPEDVKFTGNFDAAVTWSEPTGNRYLIVSSIIKSIEEKSSFHVKQYREDKEANRRILEWDINDYAGPLCAWDFIERSLQVLDLDNDGEMESMFMYRKGCDGLDPQETKLMLFSKGEKMALRGSFAMDENQDDEYVVGKEFTDKPSLFKNVAIRHWEHYAEEEIINRNTIIHTLTDDIILLEHQYAYAGYWEEYELLTSSGAVRQLNNQLQDSIKWASSIIAMPDEQSLFYINAPGIGMLHVPSGKRTHLVHLFENTVCGPASISPSGNKIAFIAMNHDKYIKQTKLFVLTFDEQNNMTKKEKYDVRAFTAAAAADIISDVKWLSNTEVQYVAFDPLDDGSIDPMSTKKAVLRIND